MPRRTSGFRTIHLSPEQPNIFYTLPEKIYIIHPQHVENKGLQRFSLTEHFLHFYDERTFCRNSRMDFTPVFHAITLIFQRFPASLPDRSFFTPERRDFPPLFYVLFVIFQRFQTIRPTGNFLHDSRSIYRKFST